MSKPDKDRKSHTVLIVEDDPFICEMYKTKLEAQGFQVCLASDGEAGLKVVRKKQPDVIVLDLVLPQMGGFEVLQRLKDSPQTKNIPVLILSNLGQKDKVEKGLDLGAEAYLVKAQFKPSEVVNKVKELLG